MGQSGKVKGSVDSPCEMEATECEESEERDKTGLAGIQDLLELVEIVDNLNIAELILTKVSK